MKFAHISVVPMLPNNQMQGRTYTYRQYHDHYHTVFTSLQQVRTGTQQKRRNEDIVHRIYWGIPHKKYRIYWNIHIDRHSAHIQESNYQFAL